MWLQLGFTLIDEYWEETSKDVTLESCFNFVLATMLTKVSILWEFASYNCCVTVLVISNAPLLFESYSIQYCQQYKSFFANLIIK